MAITKHNASIISIITVDSLAIMKNTEPDRREKKWN